MTEDAHLWTVRLTKTAESDYQSIIAWTLREFGDRQARHYSDTLSATLLALTAGPAVPGAKERSEVGQGSFTLHVARGGHEGRHFVLFRVGPNDGRHIDVLRILHDAMDLTRHIPDPAPRALALRGRRSSVGSP